MSKTPCLVTPKIVFRRRKSAVADLLLNCPSEALELLVQRLAVAVLRQLAAQRQIMVVSVKLGGTPVLIHGIFPDKIESYGN